MTPLAAANARPTRQSRCSPTGGGIKHSKTLENAALRTATWTARLPEFKQVVSSLVNFLLSKGCHAASPAFRAQLTFSRPTARAVIQLQFSLTRPRHASQSAAQAREAVAPGDLRRKLIAGGGDGES